MQVSFFYTGSSLFLAALDTHNYITNSSGFFLALDPSQLAKVAQSSAPLALRGGARLTSLSEEPDIERLAS